LPEQHLFPTFHDQDLKNKKEKTEEKISQLHSHSKMGDALYWQTNYLD
jgi:hypothetical protein